MLTDQNIGKGYYFWFYTCSSRSMLQRNFRHSNIEKLRKSKLNRESVEDEKRLTKGMPRLFRY